ncbi:MAG: SDR family oxidoreductase [Planctomycetales bacterium]
MAKFIIGCGYLGRRVGKLWLESGHEVHALTRSQSRAEELKQLGFQPLLGDVVRPETLDALPEADTVLHAVGLDRSADPTMQEVYVDGLRNVLNRLADSAQRVIYASSIGVYGQRDGEAVDEQSPCEPTRENGRICLEAENVLRNHPRFGERSVVLRLAGIYGPGRVPHQQAISAGHPIAVPADGWLNLIHVEDAAEAVLAAETRAALPDLLLISDGSPVDRRDYYAEVARLLGAPPPTFAEAVPGSPRADRSTSSKRIRNHLAKERLGFSCRYPSFREGLAAIIARD